jgi:hypothetical protein
MNAIVSCVCRVVRVVRVVRLMSAGYSAGIETAGTAPSARWGHTAVRFDDCLLIYGGRSADAEVLADCHIFNFGLGPLPPSCVRASELKTH